MEWRSWKYKNLTILILTFILSFVIGSYDPFKDLLFTLGYSAAFLAGVIFISTFTAPISAAILLILAERYSLLWLGVFSALGVIISTLFFSSFTKDGLVNELDPLYEQVTGKNHFHKLLNTKHFRWLLPVVGTLLILTPLPHTVGINFMGIHKLKNYQFVALSTLVSIIGLAFILFLSLFIKPN